MILIYYIIGLCISGYTNAAINLENGLSTSDRAEVMLYNQQIYLSSSNPSTASNKDDETRIMLSALENIMGRNVVADTIREVLESFRETVVNGNENLPPLDPLEIEHMGPFVYNANGVRATLNINDFRGEGLQWYVVDFVNFNVLRLTLGLHLTVPRLTFTGSYDALVRLALLVKHEAGGNFRLFVNRLEVDAEARIGTTLTGNIVLRQLDIKISIADFNIKIEGMVGSNLINSYINSLLQNITQDIIQNELDNISKELSHILFEIINDILREYTVVNLIK